MTPRKRLLAGGIAALLLAAVGLYVFVDAARPRQVTVAPARNDDDDDIAGNHNARANNDGPVLFGEVTDASGRGIAGATVSVEIEDETGRVRVEPVVTNARGEFLVDPRPPDLVRVRFHADSYVDAVVDAAALPQEREAFFSQRLARAVVAADAPRVCVVTHAANNDVAVPGALVIGLDKAPLAVTDESGCAVVALSPALADATDELYVAHALYGVAQVPHLPTSGERLVVALPAKATLTGRVVDDRGAAVGRGLVRLVPAFDRTRDPALRTRAGAIFARSVRDVSSIAVDDDGSFNVDVAAGVYGVRANVDGYRPTDDEEVTLTPGATTTLTLRLAASPTLSGVVVDDNDVPVAGANVHVDEARAPAARTDENGRFTLTTLRAQPTSVSVKKRGYSEVTVGGVDGSLSRLDDVRIVLHPGNNKEVVGIGVAVRAQKDEGLVVTAVEAGSPAAEAGLVVDDVIVAVDGERLGNGMIADVGKVRGQEGSTAALTVRRDGRSFHVDVERARVSMRAPGAVPAH